jgi:hypothetical protein
MARRRLRLPSRRRRCSHVIDDRLTDRKANDSYRGQSRLQLSSRPLLGGSESDGAQMDGWTRQDPAGCGSRRPGTVCTDGTCLIAGDQTH